MMGQSGRYEVYIVHYNSFEQPTYTPTGQPYQTFELASKAADALIAKGHMIEIVETMRRLVRSTDRKPS